MVPSLQKPVPNHKGELGLSKGVVVLWHLPAGWLSKVSPLQRGQGEETPWPIVVRELQSWFWLRRAFLE